MFIFRCYLFNIKDSPVTIGRDKHSSIVLYDDHSLSRTQFSFIYDKQDNLWKVYDGINCKSSTNGTWLYISHTFHIYSGMYFRLGNSIIKTNLTINNGLI